jgi:uncharacterized protein YqgV (UPF0045/DUF77 family)
MTPKEAILKIQQLFEDGKQSEEQVTKVEMAEYILKDGTKVMVSALEVGGSVELADGTPAPDGTHELADGSMIVVEAGKITEIKAPEPEVEIEVESSYKPEEEKMNQHTKDIASLRLENQKLKAEVTALQTKIKSGFGQVISLIEEMSKVPQAEPIQKSNSFKFQEVKDIKLERLNRYRNAILNQIN